MDAIDTNLRYLNKKNVSTIVNDILKIVENSL